MPVPPAFYTQRKACYEASCAAVHPLLLPRAELTADQVAKLMRVAESEDQIPLAPVAGLLRGYQRQGALPPFGVYLRRRYSLIPGRQ